MSGAHTPGQWTVVANHNGHHAVVCQDGRAVALTGFVRARDEAESIANAHLIAAAPEMLGKLERVVKIHEMTRGNAVQLHAAMVNVVFFIRATIAKAKGGAA